MTDEYALETLRRTLRPLLYNPPGWIPCHTRWHGVSQLLGLNHGQSVALCYALDLEPFVTNYPCNLVADGGRLGHSAPNREGSAQNVCISDGSGGQP